MVSLDGQKAFVVRVVNARSIAVDDAMPLADRAIDQVPQHRQFTIDEVGLMPTNFTHSAARTLAGDVHDIEGRLCITA